MWFDFCWDFNKCMFLFFHTLSSIPIPGYHMDIILLKWSTEKNCGHFFTFEIWAILHCRKSLYELTKGHWCRFYDYVDMSDQGVVSVWKPRVNVDHQRNHYIFYNKKYYGMIFEHVNSLMVYYVVFPGQLTPIRNSTWVSDVFEPDCRPSYNIEWSKNNFVIQLLVFWLKKC